MESFKTEGSQQPNDKLVVSTEVEIRIPTKDGMAVHSVHKLVVPCFYDEVGDLWLSSDAFDMMDNEKRRLIKLRDAEQKLDTI